MMKKTTLFALFLTPLLGFSQSNITFQVDMNDFTGTFTTPELNGDFNSWCGNCTPMTDANNDGIWEVTVPITADSIEYKFSFDNWAGQESLTPGSACTKTTSGFTNRFLIVNGNVTLPAVCWESCSACTGTPTSANVTFQVDLSTYTGTYGQVNLNGSFNNWCGSCAVMTDANNDKIFELTVPVSTADTIEYKFTLDGWTVDEQLTQGAPCTKTTIDGANTFTNRFLVPTVDTTLAAVCWESCATCTSIGVDENAIRDLTLSPNPSNGIIFLSGMADYNGPTDIRVVDLQGRTIHQERINTQNLQLTLNLTHVDAGIYLVQLASANGTTTRKVLITK